MCPEGDGDRGLRLASGDMSECLPRRDCDGDLDGEPGRGGMSCISATKVGDEKAEGGADPRERMLVVSLVEPGEPGEPGERGERGIGRRGWP